MRHRLTIAALVAAPLLLAGCGNDAEEAVEDSLGVEEGAERETVAENQEEYVIERQTTLKDPDTGEVLGQETESTPVTVTEETEVEREVKVDAGETTETTEGGGVPDSIDPDGGN